jgi:hypothetical protein
MPPSSLSEDRVVAILREQSKLNYSSFHHFRRRPESIAGTYPCAAGCYVRRA